MKFKFIKYKYIWFLTKHTIEPIICVFILDNIFVDCRKYVQKVSSRNVKNILNLDGNSTMVVYFI